MNRALVVLAVVLLVAGGVLATVARPSRTITATTAAATAGGAAPLLVVDASLLASRTGPVVVSARGTGPVLVAVGAADDVAAWADGAATTTATGLDDDGGIETTPAAGDEQVPDPAGSDLWVRQATGTGRAELTVDPAGGATAVLVASDGASPAPSTLELAWTSRPVPLAAWALLGVGALLLAALPVLRLRLGRRDRRREGRPPVDSSPEQAPVVIDLRDGQPASLDTPLSPPLSPPMPPPPLRPRGRRRSQR